MKTSYFKNIVVLIMAQALMIANLNAQNERSMYYMQQVPESSYGNPAFMPGFKFYLTIPPFQTVYGAYHNSGFSYNDVVTKRADDSLVFDQNKLLKAIGNNNDVGFTASEDAFALGFKAGKNYISFSLGVRASFNFHYTKDLMSLLINGNAPFIGKTVEISGAKIYGIAYTEAGIGFAREINSKLKVGARLKYLWGDAAINSENSKITLTTDPVTYALSVVSDVHLDLAYATKHKDNGDEIFDPRGMFKNPGVALDLGGEYKVNDKLSVNASILDIGSITWKEKVTNYVSSVANNNFTFNGLNVDNLFSKNSNIDSTFANLGDTIKDKFKVKELHNSFKTSLVKRVNIGATWQLDNRNLAGIVIRNEFFAGSYNPSVTLSLNHQFGRILSGTITYSYIDRSLTNIGAGLAFNLGPLQIYGVVDNVIAPMQIQKTQTINAQLGLNLVFGNMLKKTIRSEPESHPVVPEPTPTAPTQH
ncbi:MAG: DUF5723 family protein [Bacteroidota bacterium]|nr:DUF5723 family protein [Bacteroidota bacterium]